MIGSTLSILIPVYNAGRFLRATLASVRSQTRPPDEVIVLDNCSTDNTAAIAREFADLPGFRFAQNEENIGAVRNWIAVERLASCDYAMWLPGDDLLLPDCVERWHRAVAAHPGLGLYLAGRTLIDERGRDLPERNPPPRLPEGVIRGTELIDWLLAHGQPNIVAGTVVNRAEYQAAGGFDVRLRGALDYDLFLRLGGQCDAYHELAPNAVLREHEGQWSKDVIRNDNFDAEVLFDKIDEMPFLTPAQARQFVEALCDYTRVFFTRPLRDPQRTVSEIAAVRARAVARMRKWRASEKTYAQYVRLWPNRLRSWLVWFIGGSRWGIWLMHRVLAGSR